METISEEPDTTCNSLLQGVEDLPDGYKGSVHGDETTDHGPELPGDDLGLQQQAGQLGRAVAVSGNSVQLRGWKTLRLVFITFTKGKKNLQKI